MRWAYTLCVDKSIDWNLMNGFFCYFNLVILLRIHFQVFLYIRNRQKHQKHTKKKHWNILYSTKNKVSVENIKRLQFALKHIHFSPFFCSGNMCENSKKHFTQCNNMYTHTHTLFYTPFVSIRWWDRSGACLNIIFAFIFIFSSLKFHIITVYTILVWYIARWWSLKWNCTQTHRQHRNRTSTKSNKKTAPFKECWACVESREPQIFNDFFLYSAFAKHFFI